MTEEIQLETRPLNNDSDSYDDDDDEEIKYNTIKQEGGTVNGTGQQSLKHYQPTNKILSK